MQYVDSAITIYILKFHAFENDSNLPRSISRTTIGFIYNSTKLNRINWFNAYIVMSSQYIFTGLVLQDVTAI